MKRTLVFKYTEKGVTATGYTYPYREALKRNGFKWDPERKAWVRDEYLRPTAEFYDALVYAHRKAGLARKMTRVEVYSNARLNPDEPAIGWVHGYGYSRPLTEKAHKRIYGAYKRQ